MKKRLGIAVCILGLLAACVTVQAQETVVLDSQNEAYVRENETEEPALPDMPQGYEIGQMSDDSRRAVRTAGTEQQYQDGDVLLTLKDGIMTIGGTGAMKDYAQGEAPWMEAAGQISKIVVESGITRIGSLAFAECNNLKEIIFAEGLDSIGEAAFYGCFSLEEVSFPDSLKVLDTACFANCSSLASAEGGRNLRKVGDYAFQGAAFQEFTLGPFVSEFSQLALFRCDLLDKILVDPQNAAYGSENGILTNKTGTVLYRYPSGKKEAVYSIPESVTRIENSSFQDADYLTDIHLSEKVKEIKDWAFVGCTRLKEFYLPDSVTEVGDGILQDCTELTKAVFGNGISLVPYKCFKNCTSLKEVSLGRNIRVLETQAFSGCSTLPQIVIPEGVTDIQSSVFYECFGLVSVKLPSTLDKIWYTGFYACKSLKEIVLPDGLTFIGPYAFGDCAMLEELPIPESVTEIGANAFDGCSLLYLKIPEGLEQMEDGSYKAVSEFYLQGLRYYSKAFEVLDIVNQERQKAGLPGLKMDQDLLNGAMTRSEETSLYFSHTRPTNMDCFTVSPKASGENIAAGSFTAADVMTQWMNSPGHRANILTGEYQSIGIGCFQQNGVIYWVQLFGGMDSSPAVKVKDYSVEACVKTIQGGYDFYLKPASVNLSAGAAYTITAYTKNMGWEYAAAKISPRTFLWTSSSTAARVDGAGKVTAVGDGEAVITAALQDRSHLSKSCTVSVKTKTLTKIVMSETAVSLEAGQSRKLRVLFTPSDVSDKRLVWRSSSPSVASVDSTGKVTAKTPGTARIEAKSSNGLTTSCRVTVRRQISKIKLNTNKVTLGVRETYVLKGVVTPGDAYGKKVTFLSKDKGIVKVSGKGKLTPLKAGKAKVTARAANGKEAVCVVTVKKAPAYVMLNVKSKTMKKGQSYTLKKTLPKGSSGKVTFSSRNRQIASVDQKGKIKALRKGKTEIKVVTYNGKSAKVKLKVK